MRQIRLIHITLFFLAIFPAISFAKTKEGKEQHQSWVKAIRSRLHVPDLFPPLDERVWSTFAPTPGVKAFRVTYHTLDGMLVPAIVYEPDPLPSKKLPGVVVVNGHGSDKFGWYAFWTGIQFARAGAVVVTYDPIGEGERQLDRKSNARDHDRLPLPYGTYLAGLMQVDLMQAVSLLSKMPEVDASRIAVLGYSMGSFVAGIAGAIDPHIHAVVLSGGGVFGGTGSPFDHGNNPCQTAPYRALCDVMDAEQRGSILYTLNADRGPTLLMNGLTDSVMKIPTLGQGWFTELRKQTIVLHGSDDNVFSTIFYPNVGHRPSWMNPDGMHWLNHQIHFAIWSDADIDAQPLTHISQWAGENHVEIARNYLREDREGGIEAVGSDVPGLARKDLMVLPEKDWQLAKDRLIYDAWAAKILKKYPPELIHLLPNASTSPTTSKP